MNGPIDIYHNGDLIGPGPRKAAEGEHCRLPNLQDVRIAFLSAQQSLRLLQQFPTPLLNLATFPFVDDHGHGDIDHAIGLLEREVATLKTMRQNHRASRSDLPNHEPR